MLIINKGQLNGFSLVEMAVVIMIAGIMLSAGLALLTVKMNAAQHEVTLKRQEAIKQALIAYLSKNKRLPCPASINGVEDRATSASPPPCNVYSGIVPYTELGLDRATVLDGWENFITYVVSPPQITSPPAAPYTTAWLYTYSATTDPKINTNIISSAFWPVVSTGGITVKQTIDTSVSPAPPLIANPTNYTGAAVVLISYGKNGFGSINIKGGTNDSTSAGIDELQNITPVTGTSPFTVVLRDPSETATSVGGAFDDVVMMLSANDLTGPLIASGNLQSNAQAAINQANDIVMGNIIASKKPCSAYSSVASLSPKSILCGLPNKCACDVSTNHFFTIPSLPIAFPSNVTAWGVSKTLGALYMDDINYTGPLGSDNGDDINNPATAYTLTAGDGTQKTVSVAELRGLLAKAVGF